MHPHETDAAGRVPEEVREALAEPHDAAAMSSRPVLLVDDYPANLFALEVVLERLGRPLLKAGSGDEALELLSQHDCAAVLLDVRMPGRDGIATARAIREAPNTRHLPILFMTAGTRDEAQVARAYSLGGVDFIQKPFDPDALRAKLRTFIEDQDRSRLALMAQALLRMIRCDNSEDVLKVAAASARDAGESSEPIARAMVDQLGAAAGTVIERLGRIHALARERAELDQLTYVAAHDLKSPLRGIASLLEWVEEDVGEVMDETTRHHLELLRGRTARLELMLDGILGFTRAGHVRHVPEQVDLPGLVHSVFADLEPPAAATLVVPEDLPTVVTERVALEQVLSRLIGNALKHAGRDDVRIRIGWRRLDARVELSVADDGCGIAPEFQQRVWELFQTLAPRDRVEGAGMGLPSVKKAVESRGGRVELASAPGQGVRVTFTWPTR